MGRGGAGRPCRLHLPAALAGTISPAPARACESHAPVLSPLTLQQRGRWGSRGSQHPGQCGQGPPRRPIDRLDPALHAPALLPGGRCAPPEHGAGRSGVPSSVACPQLCRELGCLLAPGTPVAGRNQRLPAVKGGDQGAWGRVGCWLVCVRWRATTPPSDRPPPPVQSSGKPGLCAGRQSRAQFCCSRRLASCSPLIESQAGAPLTALILHDQLQHPAPEQQALPTAACRQRARQPVIGPMCYQGAGCRPL